MDLPRSKHFLTFAGNNPTMLSVILLMVLGIATGFLLRNTGIVKRINKLVSAAIYILLFMMGIVVGTDNTVMDNLSAIGWDALLITLGALLGSCLTAWLLFSVAFRKHANNPKKP